VGELLAALYPTVQWEHVGFHRGLPRLVRPFTRVAITLPHPLALRRVGIYVAEAHWDPCSVTGMALLVHEAMHVLQFQSRLGGAGLGVLRLFSLQYLAVATLQGGARENLFEAPAYAQEERFLSACAGQSSPLCEPAGGRLRHGALEALLARAPGLVQRLG
jgi:hypothetical protein